MDPALILFVIQAVVRLAREGARAHAQWARDRAVIFPNLTPPDFDDIDFIRDVLIDATDPMGTTRGPLAEYWDTSGTGPNPAVPSAREVLYLEAVRVFAERRALDANLLPERGTEIAGEVLVKQWATGAGPVGPLSRMVLTVADVALEFVAVNPSVVGVGGSGEKLVAAMAGSLTEMLPDDGAAFGPKAQFAERLAALFLRAGLDALTRHPDALVSDTHLQQLVRNTLPPIVNALQTKDLSEQARWREVAEALVGPAASAALSTVAENPRAFLGGDFDPNDAIGALTQSLLQQVSETGLRGTIGKAGWIALYRAALGVVADRPELFARAGVSEAERIATALFANAAGLLKNANPPFDHELGVELLVVVLETLRTQGPRLIDPNQPWETMATAVVSQVIGGLEAGLRDPAAGGLRTALSRPQLFELARVFITEAARSPEMIQGEGGELGVVVRAVATAMARDDRQLLTPTHWLSIASVAVEEAAANPQRLFRFGGDVPAVALGTSIITALLEAATRDAEKGGRRAGGVLAGAALVEAITLTLRVSSGQVADTTAHLDAIASLADALCERARASRDHLGASEWLCLYRNRLASVLESGTVALDDAIVDHILAGGGTA